MGGFGAHPLHPYAVQAIAFSLSLLIPGGVFALLGGAFFENHRRRAQSRRAAESASLWDTLL